MKIAKLKDKARVCDGIEDFYYGRREFAVYDNVRTGDSRIVLSFNFSWQIRYFEAS